MHGCPVSRLPLAMRLQRRSSLAGWLVNATGALTLGVYMLVVFPPEGGGLILNREIGLSAVAVYLVICGVTAHRRTRPMFERMRDWLSEARPPTPEERRVVLRLPYRFAQMALVRWALAIPLFGLPCLAVSWEFATEVATTTALVGLTTSTGSYLLAERLLRPAFALALDSSAPPEARSLGIEPRLLLTWVLCSGVPILLLALIPIARDVAEPHDLIAPIWFAAAAALGAGFVSTKLATAAVTRPVRELRRAVDTLGQGDLDVAVPVDDGSEIGRLQSGFNGMVAGLREREQLRDGETVLRGRLSATRLAIPVARSAMAPART